MRLHVMSDLHLEDAAFAPPSTDVDLVILAGDIDNGAAGVEWAKRTFRGPVLYVPGNHEPYDGEFHAVWDAMRAAAQGSNVRFLDRGEAVIDGVRFLGCALWTDFEFYGVAAKPAAMEAAKQYAPDFRVVRFGDRVFTPDDWVELHRVDRAWLEARLAEPFAGKTVVITHHLPHRGSVAPRYANDRANPGFVTDLHHLMGRAVLWIHGHTHIAFDYEVEGTRIVCNPRGYPHETTGFRPDFIVSI